MHWIDWLILIVPMTVILGLALYSRRYVRGVVDFLAVGRVAGRYVLNVGDMQVGLAVLTLVGWCEMNYSTGIALGFWNRVMTPIGIFLALTGYIGYRYRQSRCLSMGQLLEARYNRPFRVVAAAIRTTAETMTNALAPAVAARFFIYFLGLPVKIHVFSWEISTFAIIMFVVLTMAALVILPGGRISLLITDALQGLFSYPIFVILTCFILTEVAWHTDIAPVMLDRVPGESFLDPMDIKGMRDFNLFSVFVSIMGSVLTRGAWIGNDTTSAARNAHEQKMSGILSAWKNGFSMLMMSLIALFVIAIMYGARFANEAREVRLSLIDRAASEAVTDTNVRNRIVAAAAEVKRPKHTIGVDRPYSQSDTPDLVYLKSIKKVMDDAAEEKIQAGHMEADSLESHRIRGQQNSDFQTLKTIYYQMLSPTLLRHRLPIGLTGVFILLMVTLMLSTDDSRIFNSASTLVQDVVMPLRGRPFEKNEHLFWLRLMSLLVCGVFFVSALCFAQNDYINMFINIMTALWLGAAGPVIIGALYTRWGTTTGAFCALIFGSGTSFLGLICQNRWADTIYPWLIESGHDAHVSAAFELVNRYCSPYIVWNMRPEKFPINAYEIFAAAMILGCVAYTVGSLLTCRKPYNLDRLLHRRAYADADWVEDSCWTWKNCYEKLIGITDEYSRGDKVIAWSVFLYSIVYQFVFAFLAVAIWNWISPWPASWWSWYFYITIVIVGIVEGTVSTIWFFWGGIIDLRRLFRDLALRGDNPLDDGWVEHNVSRADQSDVQEKSDDPKKDEARK